MTFEQFQATRRYFANLSALEGWEDYTLSGDVYLYDAATGTGLAIEHVVGGGYVLTIGNSETASADRETLERALYEYAVSEGYCDGKVQS